MAKPVVLAVESDDGYFQQICAAFDELLLPRPARATSGEDAVLWVGANHCELCIVDYDLPGIDGLDALIRMRQRKPGLPAIITSSADQERIAVSAFRQGIVDYIPKAEEGSAKALAQRVDEFLKTSGNTSAARSTRRVSNVPAALQEPTYQNRLRVVGRQMDWYGYRSVNVVEVEGGFLVRGIGRGQRMPEALEFPDRDFPHLVASAFASRGEEQWDRMKTPILPTGYEDFLRALGFRLDRRSAEAISIAEFDDLVVVGGVGKTEGYEQSQIKPFHLLLKAEDVEFMLNEAFRRRAQAPSQTGQQGGLRKFFRNQ